MNTATRTTARLGLRSRASSRRVAHRTEVKGRLERGDGADLHAARLAVDDHLRMIAPPVAALPVEAARVEQVLVCGERIARAHMGPVPASGAALARAAAAALT